MDLNEAKKTIRDLLNLAGDDAAAELEVENALHFARRLMLRSNLTEEQCQENPKSIHERAADEEYGLHNLYSHGANLTQWERSLNSAIADLVGTVKWYYRTRVTRRTGHGTLAFARDGKVQKAAKITFYGPASDVLAAGDLVATWAVTIAALARMKFGGCFRGAGRNYAEGFAYALREKVWKLEEEEEALGHEEALALGGGCTTLAIVEAKALMVAKQEHASTWLKKVKGVHLTSGRSSGSCGSYDHEAYNAGQADGSRADFSQGSARKAIG